MGMIIAGALVIFAGVLVIVMGMVALLVAAPGHRPIVAFALGALFLVLGIVCIVQGGAPPCTPVS